MNKTQKEVQQAHLNAEKKVLNKLKQIYAQASKDCQNRINELNSRTDMQNLQSIIYQKQYQEALKKQIDSILDSLQSNEFNTVADYLTECYENGYVGAMYDIQKQGIPIITPINQKNVVKAVQTDSKLSVNLYTRLGEDVTKLKKTIRTELSRGTANGSTWLEMAEKISNGMNSPFKTSLNNAIRIARTEGHRIQQQSALDAMLSAKENGADVVKQWDATLDSRTRPDHQAADGQIKELDEYFRVGGEDLKAPGIGGSAKNVINCRCCVLQRARWALDEDELATLKQRASYFGLDKTDSFKEYKEKYLKTINNAEFKILSYDESKTLKEYTKEEILKLANENEKILDNYPIKNKSKWSGNIVINNKKLPSKLWSCNIRMTNETSQMIIMHEQLHARSASVYGRDEFYRNQTIEEASVQFLVQEICNKEGIEVIASGYDDLVGALRSINHIANLYDDDYTFAIELFNEDLSIRLDTLEEKVHHSIMKSGTTDDMIKCAELIEKLYTRSN